MTIERTVEVELTQEEVADAFLGMSSNAQAQVLRLINRGARESWGLYKAQCQWTMLGEAIADHEDDEARSFLADVGAHVAHFKANPTPKVQWLTTPDDRCASHQDVGGQHDRYR